MMNDSPSSFSSAGKRGATDSRQRLYAAGREPGRGAAAPLAAVFLAAALAAVPAVSLAQAPQGPPEDVAAPPEDAERTPSGLASKLLVAGTGEAPPDANDLVNVHFTGWTPQGAMFQNSYGQGRPAVFDLQNVFPGWREALQMMVTGEKRRFWIPEELGPENPASGPRGDAVFDVEMIAIRRIPNPPENLAAPPADGERTPSGAITERLEAGTGDEHPGPDSAVMLHYVGWTADGRTFDSSLARGRPTAFPLDKVMSPFAETVQMMVVGERRRVWIPDHLAQRNWAGSPEGMLVFEVLLLDILPEDALQAAKPETGSG